MKKTHLIRRREAAIAGQAPALCPRLRSAEREVFPRWVVLNLQQRFQDIERRTLNIE
jgi:hypothetical protein